MIRLELRRIGPTVGEESWYSVHVEHVDGRVLLHVEGRREAVYEAAASELRAALGVRRARVLRWETS